MISMEENRFHDRKPKKRTTEIAYVHNHALSYTFSEVAHW